ncbi:MAG: class I SAM-dependent methyltransferase [Paracoccaceae bacterium]|jgi:SAM-dependent methyltransferase
MKCRFCDNAMDNPFLDLGSAPPSNAYLGASALQKPEQYFPLRLHVCKECWLVQTEDFLEADTLFIDSYAYFSSTSKVWLRHAEQYANDIVQRLGLNQDSLVIEVGSNDGYLLKKFSNRGIPSLGIEPTASTAEAAKNLGLDVLGEFFGSELGRKLANDGKSADLIIGNNVYAHVPDIMDFTVGLKNALKPGGTITLEFPHLVRLLQHKQFDTVYHEHFSYLSLFTTIKIFRAAGLKIWHVDKIPTHGGSLRVFGALRNDPRDISPSVSKILAEEASMDLQDMGPYRKFQQEVNRVKDDFLSFLINIKKRGQTIAGYGAAAKGNTLLNYAGVKPDLLPFVCDAAPSKQNTFLPGSRIPVLPPDALLEAKPDYVLILPWNIAEEIKNDLRSQELKSTFVTAIPNIVLS